MQLRSGKTIVSNKVFDNKENIAPTSTPKIDDSITDSTSKWFKQYCIKMILLLNKNKSDYTEDVMTLHDFLMEQLRIIDELFFTISVYIPIVNVNPKIFTALYDRSVQIEKYIKKQVIKSFWKKEEEWTVETIRYAKGVIGMVQYAQEILVNKM